VLQGDRLAEADRRSAADRDAAVGAQLGGHLPGETSDLDRHMHARLREHAGRLPAQGGGDRPAGDLLLRGAQDQYPGQPQSRDLVGVLGQDPAPNTTRMGSA
jgi:hypothetical protein